MSKHRRQQRKRARRLREYQRWFASVRERLAERLSAGLMSLLNRPALCDPDWVNVAPPAGVVKARLNTKTGVLEMQMEQPLRYVTLTLEADTPLAAAVEEAVNEVVLEREA